MGDKLRIHDHHGDVMKFNPIDAGGTIAFTADQAMGANKLTGVKLPTAAAEAMCAPASVAQGDIFFWSSGTLTRLAKGGNSYFLKMNAGATAPEWQVS